MNSENSAGKWESGFVGRAVYGMLGVHSAVLPHALPFQESLGFS